MADPHQTRETINKAALALFAEQGVDATTTKDIAKTAQIAEGTIYRHYQSKDELVWTLFSQNYLAVGDKVSALAAAQTGLRFKLLAMVRHFYELFDRDEVLYRFLLLIQHRSLHRMKPNQNTPLKAVFTVIKDAMDAGEIPSQDPDLATAIVMGIVLQPSVFKVYGRLEGKMVDRAPALAAAAYQALQAPAHSPSSI